MVSALALQCYIKRICVHMCICIRNHIFRVAFLLLSIFGWMSLLCEVWTVVTRLPIYQEMNVFFVQTLFICFTRYGTLNLFFF